MPADPAAPVTEPRAELVEAAAQALGHYSDAQWARWKELPTCAAQLAEARRSVVAVLPLLTLADLPAALAEGPE